MMFEVWKPVVGYETQYEVSNYGSVRSVPRLDSTGHHRGGHLMKLRLSNKGYLTVHLRGPSKMLTVHRMVLEAFVGSKPTPKHEGAHIDGNKLNVMLSNLAWKTHIENCADKIRHGTAPRGEKNGGGGKLKADDVLAIRARVMLERPVDIAVEFGVTKEMIYSIRDRHSWKHV